jgi:uncharacterized protein YdeI (YjbR/CyaY-like superfamily)
LPAAPVPTHFRTPQAFRSWLERHAARKTELHVGFHKLGSGRPSITWPQAVDEALCFGWIDGVRRRIDEESYQIRFTPRKLSSTWSAINIERVRVLTEAGRMTAAGLEAFARRSEKKSVIYAYEQKDAAKLGAKEAATFRRDKVAWAFLQKQAASYRQRVLWGIVNAKQQATRERRLARLIQACRDGKLL